MEHPARGFPLGGNKMGRPTTLAGLDSGGDQVTHLVERHTVMGAKRDVCDGGRGNRSDSRDRGYVGEGRVLATAKLYTPIYEFRPLSEEVTALRLCAAVACRLECRIVTGGANPCARGEGWLI